MEFHNRRLLLLNEDVPISTSISPRPHLQNTEPMTQPPPPSSSSSSMHGGSSLQLPRRPIFTSNLAYAFLILFTTVFFLGFILLYIRQFSGDSFAANSPRRRRRRSSGDAADTKALPTLPYRGEPKPQQVECAICLDEFHEGETVKMIPHCKHVFHPECIDTWLVGHVTCPVCRCTKVCEVKECGSAENEGEGRREVELESDRALSEHRVTGSNSGSRFGLRRSLSF